LQAASGLIGRFFVGKKTQMHVGGQLFLERWLALRSPVQRRRNVVEVGPRRVSGGKAAECKDDSDGARKPELLEPAAERL
jgi:hypothetical protein